MSRRPSLKPEWISDLLGIWVSSDIRAGVDRLGYPRVSPMFGMLGEAESTDTEGSYSSAEVIALKLAVDRLHAEHPDEWRSVMRAFKPWTRAGLDAPADGPALERAARRLAAWVDEAVGS